METIESIDKEIAALKDSLNSVQGTETEVYTRIVGYYRAVKNWNLGKKEEYKVRRTFNQGVSARENREAVVK
ncbi:MAG: hypothetical protein DRP59_04440 [Spirochaetes bacterium]|nr:MAG: hypothetical protein DRP59_04440 [Spirochaetota bacterium]